MFARQTSGTMLRLSHFSRAIYFRTSLDSLHLNQCLSFKRLADELVKITKGQKLLLKREQQRKKRESLAALRVQEQLRKKKYHDEKRAEKMKNNSNNLNEIVQISRTSVILHLPCPLRKRNLSNVESEEPLIKRRKLNETNNKNLKEPESEISKNCEGINDDPQNTNHLNVQVSEDHSSDKIEEQSCQYKCPNNSDNLNEIVQNSRTRVDLHLRCTPRKRNLLYVENEEPLIKTRKLSDANDEMLIEPENEIGKNCEGINDDPKKTNHLNVQVLEDHSSDEIVEQFCQYKCQNDSNNLIESIENSITDLNSHGTPRKKLQDDLKKKNKNIFQRLTRTVKLTRAREQKLRRENEKLNQVIKKKNAAINILRKMPIFATSSADGHFRYHFKSMPGANSCIASFFLMPNQIQITKTGTVQHVDITVANRPWTCGKFSRCSRRINLWFREQGVQIICTCIKQLEFITAQRIERSIQIFRLYRRLWDESTFREFVKTRKLKTCHKSKPYMMGTIGAVVYNWEKERITNEEMESYANEIEEIYKLRTSTVMCSQCHQRLIIDVIQAGIKYCNCHGNCKTQTVYGKDDSWEPFIEREDMLIWRRLESDSGLYAYKVFGSFSDVTAADFLQVQLDVEYRIKWDNTAKELKIVDTDPLTESSESCGSDVIYWEMMWPRLFANRDYVYQRKWTHSKGKDIVIITSKAADHPKVPNRTDTYRVKSYWSYMVIKPYNDFNEPGIEFGLTYFDDPGVNIPSAVTAWVAMSGLPDYLCRMREATRNYKKYKSDREKSLTKVTGGQSQNEVTFSDIQSKTEESENSQRITQENLEPLSSLNTKLSIVDPQDKDKTDEIEFIAEEDQGFLNSFFFTRLFA